MADLTPTKALLVEMADLVTTELNSQTWDGHYFVAKRAYVPRYGRGELARGDFNKLGVTVVPGSYVPELLTRSESEHELLVSIGIERRTGNLIERIDPLVLLCEQIADHFRTITLVGVSSYSCFEAAVTPCVPEHLVRFAGLYTGVVAVKALVVR
jgi:hypothetical protein